MEKCPHCGTVTKKVTEERFFCSFCDMIINFEKVKPFVFRGAVDYVDAAKSTEELKNYHTFDLLLLLRFCRQERRTTYQLMQTIGLVKHKSQEFAEGYNEAYKQYDYWTKKTRISESLIKGRLGSVPKAVSNELLERFLIVCEEEAAVMEMYA